jgi:hypothetical protein
MKIQKILPALLVVLLLHAGCSYNHTKLDMINGQINVFGVELFSDIDYKEINGVVATEEPCLKGYERSFDALDLSIGYGFDKKIRKISTRNLNTNMFGIKPGMAFEEGKKMILQAGFTEFAPPFTFKANGYSLTFLVDGDNKIFGLTLESLSH